MLKIKKTNYCTIKIFIITLHPKVLHGVKALK
jgi:hypothetical protein